MMAALREQAAAAMARTVVEMTLEEDKKVFIEAIERAIAEVASRTAEDNWRRVAQALRFS